MSAAGARPVIPLANPDTQPFWDGCARGEFLLQRCAECGAYRHPPSPRCLECLSDRHEWIAATGRGTVYSFVIVREPLARGWEKLVPFVVAVIDLDEGIKVYSNVVNVAPGDVTIGMPVEVTFEELDGTTRLPVFSPR